MNLNIKLINLFILYCLILQTSYVSASSERCIIDDGGIHSIRIGDSVPKIFSVFESQYDIRDIKKPDYVRQISVLDKGKVIFEFSIDSGGKIFLIDIYGHCVTKENIGRGSTLFDAISTYGQGSLDPTDRGYYVFFEKLKGVLFLLNDDDIPKELRNIPDDALTLEEEKRILSIGKIRILAIQIFRVYE